MKILVVNGPNLNRLGKRQPEIYGSTSLADIEQMVAAAAKERGLEAHFFQSNHEGDIVERIHQVADDGWPVIINPGAFTHTSVAIRDALAEVADGPGFIEVHLSNVHAREEFRRRSYLSDIARGVVAGLGPIGYVAALDYFSQH